MRSYGQFCPVAIATQVLGERWTIIVLRELVSGSTRFNDLRRGVPLMSPSLLSKRLKTLERAGIVERHEVDGNVEYRLTPAGEDLGPVIESIGAWGQRWARGQIEDDHLDASLLMWDIHRNVIDDNLPEEQVVVHFHLEGSTDGKRRFWLVLEPDDVDICLVDPGLDVDVYVECHVRTMVRYWMGDAGFHDLMRDGDLHIEGPTRLVRQFPKWFRRSAVADVEHPVPSSTARTDLVRTGPG